MGCGLGVIRVAAEGCGPALSHTAAIQAVGSVHRLPLVPGTAVFAACLLVAVAQAAGASEPEDALRSMTLEQLANTEVTSVSKSAEPLRTAAAAIYVISRNDILRSGASSIPEALRLAPNLLVTQLSSSNYVISARGFGGNPADQAFSNKLLILIDGRSVYSPLFTGVYTDAQDVLLEDIDRIEIISGPGATLWGANAVNGVINIITRSANDTTGVYAGAGVGNQEQNASSRMGGRLNDDVAYRFYGMGFHRNALELADRSSAQDAWSKGQGGFRLDWSRPDDSSTLQGDVYRATENQLDQADTMISGANVLARWRHSFSDRSQLQLQGYVDQTERFSPSGDGAFVLHTYDVELQQTLDWGSRQRLIWGAGERINDYQITDATSLLFVPPDRKLKQGDVFAQDTIALSSALSLILGIKFENDPFSGWTTLPDERLSYQLSDSAQLWAANSRSVRSPAPFDVDVVEKLGGQVYLTGNPQFRSSRLSSYQLGYREQPAAALSFSVSLYYNYYDDLRSIDPAPLTFIPLQWGNLLAGHTYGVEVWGTWQVSEWWRLSPGLSTVQKRLYYQPGALGTLGVTQTGNDPGFHVALSSSMDLPQQTSLDGSLRYVSAVTNPGLAGYYDLSARYAWHASERLELSLDGSNLLHARHYEYPAPYGEQITRSVTLQAQWRY